MPCTYEDFTPKVTLSKDKFEEISNELNLTTRLLCEVTGILSRLPQRVKLDLSDELKAWIKNHEIRDKKRQEEIMEGFTCPQCNVGDIVMRTGSNRRMRYRHIPNLELPAGLAIPTCDNCGEMWLDSTTTKSLEIALESAYRAQIAKAEKDLIEAQEALAKAEKE